MYSDAALINRVDLFGAGMFGQLHWGVVGALMLALFGGFLLTHDFGVSDQGYG